MNAASRTGRASSPGWGRRIPTLLVSVALIAFVALPNLLEREVFSTESSLGESTASLSGAKVHSISEEQIRERPQLVIEDGESEEEIGEPEQENGGSEEEIGESAVVAVEEVPLSLSSTPASSPSTSVAASNSATKSAASTQTSSGTAAATASRTRTPPPTSSASGTASRRPGSAFTLPAGSSASACFSSLVGVTIDVDKQTLWVAPEQRDAMRAAIKQGCACVASSAGRGAGERLTVPLLAWVDVRMRAFQAWHEAVPEVPVGPAGAQLFEPAMALTRPQWSHTLPGTTRDHARLADTCRALVTPAAFLVGELGVTLDAPAACAVVNAGATAAAGGGGALPPSSVLWAPEAGIAGIAYTPHPAREGIPRSSLVEDLAARAAAYARGDGGYSGPLGGFSPAHLDRAVRAQQVDTLALLDAPNRVALTSVAGAVTTAGSDPLHPVSPLGLNENIFYDLHHGADVWAAVKAQHAAASSGSAVVVGTEQFLGPAPWAPGAAAAAAPAAAGRLLRAGPPASDAAPAPRALSPRPVVLPSANSWMYVSGASANYSLTLLTLPDAFLRLASKGAPRSITRAHLPEDPAAGEPHVLAGGALANVFWHAMASKPSAMSAAGAESLRAARAASSSEELVPLWTHWADNHFHRFTEAHTRTAALIHFIGYTRGTPFGEHGFTRNVGYGEEPLGIPGLTAVGAALGEREVQHAALLHLLDAPITNWPDWAGLLALRERIRHVLGLPPVTSLAYLKGGPAAPALSLPWAMHHPQEAAVPALDVPTDLHPRCPRSYASGRVPRLLVHSRTHSRYLRNHEKLVAALRSRVYAHVTILSDDASTANWTMTQQLRAFGAADVVVAPHGAALGNLIAMAPGAVVVEVPPEGWRAHFYMHMAAVLGLPYARVEAQGGKFDSLSAPLEAVLDAVCGALARAEAARA